jgi:ribonuclease BN (tRNA processing enzyme)
MIERLRCLILSGVVVMAVPLFAAAQSCATGPTTVQILGSGGPELNPERASASYLLWVGGKARVLLDMGGGAYLRFAQSQAKTSDLALVAISHLHPDHVSDLPAFLWLSHLVRTEPLAIVGPSGGKGVAAPAGNDVAPDLPTFLARLFDEKTGAFEVLGRTLGGRGNGVRLNVNVIDVMKTDPSLV